VERLSGFGFVKVVACGLLAAFAVMAMAADTSAASRKRAAIAPVAQCPTAGTRSIGFAKAVDGVAFLAADGKEVRLAGVTAAAGDAARQALASALQTGALTLVDESAPDRYGRIVAEVFADGAWVQANLLKAGTLRVAPDRAGAPCAKQLLAAEDEARSMHAGHWRDGAFALRTPEQLRSRAGNFETAEGTVTTATIYKGRAYINFGADYRTDFTVTIAPEDMKLFRTARFDVKKLAGKRVRVRGWVESYNGPEIQIATPQAIEILDTDNSESPPLMASTAAEPRKDTPRRTRRKKPRTI
jgi:endonuclease YncB( thermonuclease family)